MEVRRSGRSRVPTRKLLDYEQLKYRESSNPKRRPVSFILKIYTTNRSSLIAGLYFLISLISGAS